MPKGKEFMTIEETAEYLRRPIGTIRDWVQRKIIPNYKRGKRLFFDREEIDRWDRENHYRPALSKDESPE